MIWWVRGWVGGVDQECGRLAQPNWTSGHLTWSANFSLGPTLLQFFFFFFKLKTKRSPGHHRLPNLTLSDSIYL